jgi:transposase InsO family protein
MSLKVRGWVDHLRMIVHMHSDQLVTLDQVRAFLAGTSDATFSPAASDADRYQLIVSVLCRFQYARATRADKGLLRAYLLRVSGYSRAQLTRLMADYRRTGQIKAHYRAPVKGFTRKYSDADARLLAEVDALHGTLSGPATKCLLERAYAVHGDARFATLRLISVAHLYNLRKHRAYKDLRVMQTKTRPTTIQIGIRRAPKPDGFPGYIRIDSVHQGDFDGEKGVYHINSVDCVTQWELVGSCEKISEAFLSPVLEHLLDGFPFTLLGFHADNGSEYINHTVAKLLNKLHIEFTRSRPRHSNDNALAETKNGVVVRKQFGYAHIPQRFARQINSLCTEHLNPYLNYHRPCLFPTDIEDSKGKIKKLYRQEHIMTPFDKFKSLDKPERFLKPGIALEDLDAIAHAMTDNQAAERLNKAKAQLFRSINQRSKPAA